MLSLFIRTDNPEAELSLFKGDKRFAHEAWLADRQLAETIHSKITEILKANGKGLADVEGVVCFRGPGSFTGLRIGLSVGNALAYSLGVPIIGAEGKDWQEKGLQKLHAGADEKIVTPKYGAPARTTSPRK